jgi:hypothetical protein
MEEKKICSICGTSTFDDIDECPNCYSPFDEEYIDDDVDSLFNWVDNDDQSN